MSRDVLLSIEGTHSAGFAQEQSQSTSEVDISRSTRGYNSSPFRMHLRVSVPDRVCFICLDGSEDPMGGDFRLVSCCSQCYAVSHIRCWKEWRHSQAMHARRARVAGNRVGTDPFLCSICKSGAARLRGEWVSLKWLHSFVNFGEDRGPRVRFASGLFTALTGAREENGSGQQDGDEGDDDFIEYIENQPENDRVSFLCGDTRKFVIIMVILAATVLGSLVTFGKCGIVESSYLLMMAVAIFLVAIATLSSYVFVRYNRLLNSRTIS